MMAFIDLIITQTAGPCKVGQFGRFDLRRRDASPVLIISPTHREKNGGKHYVPSSLPPKSESNTRESDTDSYKVKCQSPQNRRFELGLMPIFSHVIGTVHDKTAQQISLVMAISVDRRAPDRGCGPRPDAIPQSLARRHPAAQRHLHRRRQE